MDFGGLRIDLGGRAGLDYALTGNTNFGAGFDVGSDGSVDHNVDYAEGFLEPTIDLSYRQIILVGSLPERRSWGPRRGPTGIRADTPLIPKTSTG
jgi:hypothetical protein